MNFWEQVALVVDFDVDEGVFPAEQRQDLDDIFSVGVDHPAEHILHRLPRSFSVACSGPHEDVVLVPDRPDVLVVVFVRLVSQER